MLTNEELTKIANESEALNAVAVRGVIQVRAGNRPNEGTVSTYMDAATATKVGVSRAGTLTCYLDLDTIEAMCAEANLRPMCVGSLLVTEVSEKTTEHKDAKGNFKTRISGVLLGVRGVEGGLKAGFNFENIRKAADLNAKLNVAQTAAAAGSGVTLGA